jgi:type II secretory pathway component PulM
MLTGLAVGAGIAAIGIGSNGNADPYATLGLIGFLAILIVGGLIWQRLGRRRERLRAQAEAARQFAARERGLSNEVSNDRGGQLRTSADQRGPSAAAQDEDTKA